MNILFLSPQLPYPGISGGTIKSKHLLDYFCQRYSVTLVSLIKKSNHGFTDGFMKEYSQKLKGIFFFKVEKSRSAINYLMSIIRNIPVSIYRNSSFVIKNKIKQIIEETSFDIVFCEHLLMVQYIPVNMYFRTILHEENAEHMIWQRYAQVEKNKIKKLLAKIESLRMFRYETNVCRAVPAIMAAPNDITILKQDAQNSKFFITYHLGYDDALQFPAVQNKHNHKLLFIGTMTWEANSNAMDWFVRNVYMNIKASCPDVSLWIAGTYSTKPFYFDRDNSIHVLGFVDNLQYLYESSDIFICPLQYGSGMKIKILDAMYHGLPIVTTSIGAESIDLVDGDNCFIADTKEDFFDKIITLLKDDLLWEQFSKNSRNLSAEQYSWKNEYQRINVLMEHFAEKIGTTSQG